MGCSVTLSEIRQKTNTVLFHLHEVSKVVRPVETKWSPWAPHGGGCLTGTASRFGEVKSAVGWTVVTMAAQSVTVLDAPELCVLQWLRGSFCVMHALLPQF